jgi:hypothetical protein
VKANVFVRAFKPGRLGGLKIGGVEHEELSQTILRARSGWSHKNDGAAFRHSNLESQSIRLQQPGSENEGRSKFGMTEVGLTANVQREFSSAIEFKVADEQPWRCPLCPFRLDH